MMYTLTGAIIRELDWKEYDRLYTVYTVQRGKTTIIARGIRRPQSKLKFKMQRFRELDLTVTKGRMFDVLTGVQTIDSPLVHPQSHMLTAGWTSLINEVIDRLLDEDQPDVRLYKLLVYSYAGLGSIADFNEGLMRSAFITARFMVHVLRLTGYQIRVDDCARCHENLPSGRLFFSYDQGGLVCNNCYQSVQNGRYITMETRNQLQALVANKAFNQLPVLPKELITTLIAFTRYCCERDIMSERYIQTFIYGLQ